MDLLFNNSSLDKEDKCFRQLLLRRKLKDSDLQKVYELWEKSLLKVEQKENQQRWIDSVKEDAVIGAQ